MEPSGSRSTASLAAWVGVKLTVIREMISGPVMSDEAAGLYLRLCIGIAQEIGHDAFNDLTERVVMECERRPTIATLRRMAGLVKSDEPSATMVAWDLVSRIVSRHIGFDGEGNAILVPKVLVQGVQAISEKVPEIPGDVARAVHMMGGWQSLANSYPTYWGMRFKDFKEVFVPNEIRA